jgi:hypothetical protein
MFLRRLLPIFVAATLFGTLILLTTFQNSSWKHLPETIGLGETYGVSTEDLYAAEELQKSGKITFKEPKIDSTSPYPLGQTKPPGSNYTKCLVLPKLAAEDTAWVESELEDMIEVGSLRSAIYVVDDALAPLHPPKNKGHEVMVYLSYIIDHYDDLADVNIFMHSHRKAWHNNELLGRDAAMMVRRLSPERVTREGYMNLRCHWDPGCPVWLHPGNTVADENKQEELLLAVAWSELFPYEPVPTVLAQPCCAQFAVSGERIRELPKERYVYMRDWLLRTEINDYLSGRVFEYIWQYIFTAAPIHCPSMSACYCDGYGICFGNAEKFDKWFELRFDLEGKKEELRLWQEKADLIEEFKMHAKNGKMADDALLEVPQFGRDRELKMGIEKLREGLDERIRKAVELGRDPRQRALESGREWMEGDGY